MLQRAEKQQFVRQLMQWQMHSAVQMHAQMQLMWQASYISVAHTINRMWARPVAGVGNHKQQAATLDCEIAYMQKYPGHFTQKVAW
eukprot:scaffold110851_cov18-Tisochrysis_lutea.AAC.2